MQHEDISPEVFKAQRMAELEQIARYREKRLAQFKAWSDPIQRAQILANMGAEDQRARELVAGKTVWLRPLLKLEERIDITPIPEFKLKDKFKKSWIERVKGWFK